MLLFVASLGHVCFGLLILGCSLQFSMMIYWGHYLCRLLKTLQHGASINKRSVVRIQHITISSKLVLIIIFSPVVLDLIVELYNSDIKFFTTWREQILWQAVMKIYSTFIAGSSLEQALIYIFTVGSSVHHTHLHKYKAVVKILYMWQ